jgi:hypothetical protein
LSRAINILNAGVASEVYGGESTGNLFEKVVLWLKASDDLACCQDTFRHWKSNTDTDGMLRPGCLYQLRISNLGTIVLPMAVSEKHPIKQMN